MKKLVLFLAIIVLFGCDSPVVENEEIDGSKNLEQKEMSAEEKEFLFEKNQECAKWIPIIEKRLKEFRNQQLQKDSFLPWLPAFQEIFYSSKTNSCLYIDNVTMGENDPFIMRRLVDVSDGVAVDPVDNMSCQYVANYVAYSELREYNKNQGEEELAMFDFARERYEKECEEFDRKIEEEYKIKSSPTPARSDADFRIARSSLDSIFPHQNAPDFHPKIRVNELSRGVIPPPRPVFR